LLLSARSAGDFDDRFPVFVTQFCGDVESCRHLRGNARRSFLYCMLGLDHLFKRNGVEKRRAQCQQDGNLRSHEGLRARAPQKHIQRSCRHLVAALAAEKIRMKQRVIGESIQNYDHCENARVTTSGIKRSKVLCASESSCASLFIALATIFSIVHPGENGVSVQKLRPLPGTRT
jgi:hypothetical protein